MSLFTWIPYYTELADKLIAYRDRQAELIGLLKAVKDRGLPVTPLADKDAKGNMVPLSAIDPFTFFAAFNRQTRDDNRQAVLTEIKACLGIAADIPADFHGIPVMDPRKSRFFGWQGSRKPDDIPSLWAFADALVRRAPDEIPAKLFNRCLEGDCVTPTNLTMGMFWMRPETYVALDGRNCKLLDARGIPHAVTDWASYLTFLKTFQSRTQETPSEFSRAAYTGAIDVAPLSPATPATAARYWIYAPGPRAAFWDECWEKGIMLLGYDQLPDLRGFSDQAAIEKALIKAGKLEHRPYNDSLACWGFANVLKPGDVVIPKKGRTAYLGYGIVSGEYERDEARSTYRNFRRIKWVKKGNWSSGEFKTVTKTLTDVTKYPTYVSELKALLGIDENATPSRPQSLPALNIILYGPPGTGKTYALRNEYMERFTERAAAVTKDDFTTDLVADMAWWQVITMVMLDLKTSRVSGILEHPLMQARIRRANNRTPRAAVWAHLQMHTQTACTEVKYAKRYEPLLFSKDAKSVWSIDEKLATDEVPELVDALNRYREFKPGQGAVIKRYEFITFHQSYSYEDFVEGIKPVISEDAADSLVYEIKFGIFKTMVQRAAADPTHNYALLIDEISRGNVASIFGELITLIEDDKRQGGANELTARLPYSGDAFVVPQNLYIVGAMNTADRSVEALDTALRRRFVFVRMPPLLDRIPQPANLDVDLKTFVGVINGRIEKLLDKDHCIGHSYFMGIAAKPDPLRELQAVVATKLLPLLEEYFYGDPAKIGMVLGERFVVRNDEAVAWAPGDWGMDEFQERRVYSLRDPATLTSEDFCSVYA